jgi:hypothetical protein
MDHPVKWKECPDGILNSEIDVKFVMKEIGKKKTPLKKYATNKAEQEAEKEVNGLTVFS